LEIDLRAFLRRHRLIALDTNIFVYLLELNSRYVRITDQIFSWVATPSGRAVTSTLTMAELLVPCYRDGDEQQANEFYALLSTFPNLDWIAPNLEIADLAAQIRGLHGLRTPDALQAATAIYAHATAFLTNDPVFDRVDQFETLVLDRLL
jgi:predicted nucleic acid-binding protein